MALEGDRGSETEQSWITEKLLGGIISYSTEPSLSHMFRGNAS